jgi:hypothetical protein
MSNQTEAGVYWLSPVLENDDFGEPIIDEFIDGRTAYGPWAIMSPLSYTIHGPLDASGLPLLGTGHGQRFRKQLDGRWLKVEG